ncbi:esterase-like activity of phytase family protein [Pelagicoccus enzymogenes]|uniref:esterase-like activity of phytase family protein n=1 Tax=Pelagicoccus enzymogenes TaxID=2773457 RepID=UPI00280DAF0B|nr:esterase-like activity of phytase family protein [Pelagicoccus enzymogenes]MDQ8199746.1 esterase-like activity of phytase family protein [Pelagicoccus enzymogenes]
MRPARRLLAAIAALAASQLPIFLPASAQKLTGFTTLPADSFAEGPTSGQFIDGGANGRTAPFKNKQPVQGFSAMLANGDGTFWMLSDNGFGSKANSQDYLLRIYRVRPKFPTGAAGNASVEVLEFLTLSDPQRLIPFEIMADRASYPTGDGSDSGIPVDPAIKSRRLLTGGDLDIESVRIDAEGTFWFGDEFGPFLIQCNAQGELLQAPIPLPGIATPDDPLGRPANHPRSGGFEGMSINQAGTLLYPMLEKPLAQDQAAGLRRLPITPFDVRKNQYTGETFYYPLEPESTAIGDFSPISDTLHMVIERDGGSGPTAVFKKVFIVDLTLRDEQGTLLKKELVDLLNLPDPYDLDQDGSHVFTFPFVTIEDVVLIDENTIAVANDNNYPFSAGRAAKPIIDNNEIILIRFDSPLVSMKVKN